MHENGLELADNEEKKLLREECNAKVELGKDTNNPVIN